VVAKATFGPRWRVTVDGVRLKPEMVAPDLLGQPVSAGAHRVEFRYVPFHGYLILLSVSVLGLVGLEFLQRWFGRPRVEEPA
jgi:uncharacterized membrane protein YfhO